MRFTFGLAILTLVYFVFVNSRTPLSLHRTKRELYDFFVKKHIIFLTKEQQIEHSFLRTKLPGKAKKRSLHTLIIVLGENDKTENQQMMALQKQLDDVISKKIRINDCEKGSQDVLKVKPNTCLNNENIKKNETQYFFNLSNYFFCSVAMNELNVVKLYLLNFNPMNDTGTCEYSEHGWITLGAGEIKDVPKEENNRWFIVNHLEYAYLEKPKMKCNKK